MMKNLSKIQKEYLELGMKIIDEVSRVSLPYMKDLSKIKPLDKNPKGDITLTIDSDAEIIAEKIIKKSGTSCVKIGEEYGTKKLGTESPEFIFFIDPIDGSHNAKRGLPFFSSVVGFAKYSQMPTLDDVEVGIVKNLCNGDLFIGIKGKGATLNGKRFFPSQNKDIHNADLIINLENKTQLIEKYLKLILSVHDVKRFGSSALELCYTASNCVDAFFDPRETVGILDIFAPILIAREGGCVITDAYGERFNPILSPDIGMSVLCVGNKILHKKILNLIR